MFCPVNELKQSIITFCLYKMFHTLFIHHKARRHPVKVLQIFLLLRRNRQQEYNLNFVMMPPYRLFQDSHADKGCFCHRPVRMRNCNMRTQICLHQIFPLQNSIFKTFRKTADLSNPSAQFMQNLLPGISFYISKKKVFYQNKSQCLSVRYASKSAPLPPHYGVQRNTVPRKQEPVLKQIQEP